MPIRKKPHVQGEGDYEAARRYRRRQADYLVNNDVEKAAVRAAPRSRKEAEEQAAAEAAGKKRARGEDRAVRRRSAPLAVPSIRGRGSRH